MSLQTPAQRNCVLIWVARLAHYLAFDDNKIHEHAYAKPKKNARSPGGTQKVARQFSARQVCSWHTQWNKLSARARVEKFFFAGANPLTWAKSVGEWVKTAISAGASAIKSQSRDSCGRLMQIYFECRASDSRRAMRFRRHWFICAHSHRGLAANKQPIWSSLMASMHNANNNY